MEVKQLTNPQNQFAKQQMVLCTCAFARSSLISQKPHPQLSIKAELLKTARKTAAMETFFI